MTNSCAEQDPETRSDDALRDVPKDSDTPGAVPGFTIGDQVWRALCHDMDAAVTICDRRGNIVYANEHSNRFFRWQKSLKSGLDTAERGARESVKDAAAHAAIEERVRLFERVCETGQGVAYESLVQGVRHYVTVRPLEGDAGERFAMIVARRMHAWERAEHLADGTLEVVEPEHHDPGVLATLSPRELDVLVLLGEGLPHADIAERLGLSVRTIERHRDRLGQKLHAKNRIDLARFAIRAGLAGLPDPAQAFHLQQHPHEPLVLSEPLRRLAQRRVRLKDVR